jgi:hypothetical protein
MSGLTTAAAQRYIDDSFLTAARTAPVTPIKVRLLTVTGTASAAGTEASGGSYAAQQIDTHMAAATSANPSVGATNAILTYTNMPAATITGIDIFDNAGTPFRWWWGGLTANKTTNAGDTLSFSSGAITASVSS